VWGGRLLAGWAVAEVACARGWAESAGYWLLQTVVTALALAVVAVTGVAAWRVLRNDGSVDLDTERPAPFLAVSGVLASALFALLIMVEGTSVYLVGCG
jgi:hypothetical protein